ncbi:MAG: hypothetical protein P8X74_03680 [Reinekea sp.]
MKPQKLGDYLKTSSMEQADILTKCVDKISEYSGVAKEKLDIIIYTNGVDFTLISLFLNPGYRYLLSEI